MLKFNRNMGILDRIARTLIGVSLLIIGPFSNLVETDTLSNVILSGMGVTALLSAVFSYCLLYEITGFDTGGKQE